MKKLFFLILAMPFAFFTSAQERLSIGYMPKGEYGVKTLIIDDMLNYNTNVSVTPKEIVLVGDFTSGVIFKAPAGTEIRHVQRKLSPYSPSKTYLLVLLTNNETYQLHVTGTSGPYTAIAKKLGAIPLAQYEQGTTIVGDDLYVMSDRGVYISSDTPNHQVWTIDTIGLQVNGSSLFFHDIDIDTSQKVWLATEKGLFTQLLASLQWNKVAGYTSPVGFFGPDKVFVDRQQRIWVAEGPYVYVSADGGSSFQAAPANTSVSTSDFGDDAFGNVYLIKQGKAVYFSQGGTQPFVRIDMPVLADMTNFGPNSVIYADISGDTTIALATAGGMYMSDDQGASWTYSDKVSAVTAACVAATTDNRLLMTTNTGFFRKEPSNIWTKLFPTANTHLPGMEVFTDANGAIYHTGEVAYSDQSNGSFMTVRKSTDNGNSFVVDTLGAKAAGVYMNPFFVDESGVQHAAAVPFITGIGVVPKVWKKEAGQPWTLDTAGLSFVTGLAFNASFRCFGSDNAGNIYMVVLNNGNSLNYVFKRAMTGGSWTADGTMGGIVTEIGGRGGKLLAATSGGVQQNTGGTWSVLPKPAGLQNATAGATAVSANGIVWAHFHDGVLGNGIWYTTDMINWRYPQPNVDSSIFKKLVPMGDSLFAVGANFEHVYVFDTSTINSVDRSPAVNNDLDVVAVPNPFTGTTSLQFSLDAAKTVSLSVYDITGALVYQRPSVKLAAGPQRIEIYIDNASQPGLLAYKLEVDGKAYTGKLLKE